MTKQSSRKKATKKSSTAVTRQSKASLTESSLAPNSVLDAEAILSHLKSTNSWAEFHEYLVKSGSQLPEMDRLVLYGRVSESLKRLLVDEEMSDTKIPPVIEVVKIEDMNVDSKKDDTVPFGLEPRRRTRGVPSLQSNQITNYFTSQTGQYNS